FPWTGGCVRAGASSRRTPAKRWNPWSASAFVVAAPMPVARPVITTCPRSPLTPSSSESRGSCLETRLQVLRRELVDLGGRRPDGVRERSGDQLGMRVVVGRDDRRRPRGKRLVHLLADLGPDA